jgi:ribosomal protein S18 acetylase RimI-like enzyme
LYSIAVDGQYAGQRIGSRLLSAAENAAHHRGANAMRLEVREANVLAVNLYRKFGYSLIGRILDYYEDKSTALRLQKRLSRPSSSTA